MEAAMRISAGRVSYCLDESLSRVPCVFVNIEYLTFRDECGISAGAQMWCARFLAGKHEDLSTENNA